MKLVSIYMVVLGVALLLVRCDEEKDIIPAHLNPPAFALLERHNLKKDQHPYYLNGEELYRFSGGYIGSTPGQRFRCWGMLWQRMLITQEVYGESLYWHLFVSASEIDTQDTVAISQMVMEPSTWRWSSSKWADSLVSALFPGDEDNGQLAGNWRSFSPYDFRRIMPDDRIGTLFRVMDNFNAVAHAGGNADESVLLYTNKLRKAFEPPSIWYFTADTPSDPAPHDYGYSPFDGEDYQFFRKHWVFDDYADNNYK